MLIDIQITEHLNNNEEISDVPFEPNQNNMWFLNEKHIRKIDWTQIPEFQQDKPAWKPEPNPQS